MLGWPTKGKKRMIKAKHHFKAQYSPGIFHASTSSWKHDLWYESARLYDDIYIFKMDMLLDIHVRMKRRILNVEWEVAVGEAKKDLLRLQECCMQRICWITEDTEFLRFTYMITLVQIQNNKSTWLHKSPPVICKSVTGSVTVLYCLWRKSRRSMRFKDQDGPSFLWRELFLQYFAHRLC